MYGRAGKMSLFGDDGKRSMRDLAAELLNYQSDIFDGGFGAWVDTNKL